MPSMRALIYLTNSNLSIYLSIYLSMYVSIYLSIHPSIHPSSHPPTHSPPTHPLIHPSIYLSVYLLLRRCCSQRIRLSFVNNLVARSISLKSASVDHERDLSLCELGEGGGGGGVTAILNNMPRVLDSRSTLVRLLPSADTDGTAVDCGLTCSKPIHLGTLFLPGAALPSDSHHSDRCSH